MKKLFGIIALTLCMSLIFVGCNTSDNKSEEPTKQEEKSEVKEDKVEDKKTEDKEEDKKEDKKDADKADSKEIIVVSREAGSGTRGAFVELTGVEEDKQDNTYAEAVIQNGTDAVMTTVSNDANAIGYISLGSLNETVKALKVDGVQASVEDIKNGSYKISRPFNICYIDGELNEAAQNFVEFIFSEEGQKIVEEKGYITVKDDAKPFEKKEGLKAQLTIGGSTSVTPVMEALAEAYADLNPDVEINIESTGSTAGVTGAIDGTVDIGMASRELKEEELAKLKGEAIALDGIAVIVSNDNPVSEISTESIKDVFTGKVLDWKDVK